MALRVVSTRVVILLATFDGAAFLGEQLASIAAQGHDDWRLIWRDDGSGDDTVAMLREFAARQAPGQVEQLDARAGRVGSAASFLALLRHAVPRLGPDDIIAFADQDDVWLDFKLERAVAKLRAGDATIPAIYTARQVLVDARLRRLGLSDLLVPPMGFPAALTQNLAIGCTVALNQAAARLVAGSVAPAGCQHDWWAYLLVTAAGGALIADAEPVVLYRQHDRNAVGAPRSFTRRALAALKRGPGLFMRLMRENVASLDAQRALLTPQARAELDEIKAALDGGPWRRLRARRLRRQHWSEQMLFRLWYLMG